jgi:hypothetical protein
MARSARQLSTILAVLFLAGSAGSGAEVPDGVSSAPVGAEELPVTFGTEVESEPPGRAPEQSYNAFLRIAGTALKPRDSDSTYEPAGGGGCFYAQSGEFYIFNVPLTLPQGSTLKYLRMYYDDTSASTNSRAWLTVYDLYGNIVDEWGVNSSGSSGTGYSTTEEITHDVDYESYSYMINWRPNQTGSAMKLCGFRVYYHSIELFSDGFEVGDTSRWSATVP